MLHIERIRMRLPEGFEYRASGIARLVGEFLAEIHPPESRTLDELSIRIVQVSPNATDKEIAHSVAKRITSTLGSRT